MLGSNVDYAALDAVDLISSPLIRDIMRSARDNLDQNRFKECLEKLAEAISHSNLDLFPVGVHVSTGNGDAETALTLSAYGVEPGRFIALQRLLPAYDWMFVREPHWAIRQYGHEANWTRPNAEFAYEETANLLTRLQGANPYPSPSLYEDVFRDVVIVKVDAPQVTLLEWTWEGWIDIEFGAPQFAKGDRIKCRARGANSAPIGDPEQCNRDPEASLLVVAIDAENPRIVKEESPLQPTLIFRREDVDLEKELLYPAEE